MSKTTTKKKSIDTEKNGKATHQVLSWLEEYVEANGLTVGDMLPSEDEIMRMTATGRSSVREAVNQLKALGIVESRRKRGMRLERPLELIELLHMLSSPTIPKNLVGDVGSFRCALEFGLVSEIFRNATSDDIAELRHILNEMKAHRDEPQVWIQWDCHFHEKLLAIPGNKIAIWLSHMLKPYFTTIGEEVPPMMDQTRKLHTHILDALEQRDFAAFYQAVYDHNFHKLSANMDDWPKVVYQIQIVKNDQTEFLQSPGIVEAVGQSSDD